MKTISETSERIKATPADKQDWLKMRSQDLTSTEVSALFNINPYQTKFEVWHRHKNTDITEIQENERMKWGSRLEDAIARGIAEDNGWHVEPFKDYMRMPHARIGSSFDFCIFATRDGIATTYPCGILEIKNVDSLAFRNSWTVDSSGNIEAPPHIELQIQHQLLVSGLEYAYIGALVGGNKIELIKREPIEDIHDAILKKAEEFWHSIDNNIAPNPDFQKDADLIKRLYNYADPGKVMQADNRIIDLAQKYKAYSDQIKVAERGKDGVKAELLTLIGDSEKVKAEQFSISAGMIGESQISYTRKPYRDFKVTFKKMKTEEGTNE